MKKSPKFDVVKTINDIIIQGLEQKGLDWFKPWRDDLGNLADAVRYEDGNPYRGTNKFLLNWYTEVNGHKFNQWMTFNQAKKLGGKCAKGKSQMVILWQPTFVVKKDGQKDKWFKARPAAAAYAKKVKGKLDAILTTKYFNVWNVADVDGVEPKKYAKHEAAKKEQLKFQPSERAEAVISDWSDKPKFTTGSQAYYTPSRDVVTMPEKSAFCDSDSYYKVLFHECIHATGHESRLNRPSLTGAIASPTNKKQEYSKEELVAEIGAMYLTGYCDLDPKDNLIQSKSYINGWISHLKDHKFEAVAAMQRAEKATNHILQTKTSITM